MYHVHYDTNKLHCHLLSCHVIDNPPGRYVIKIAVILPAAAVVDDVTR